MRDGFRKIGKIVESAGNAVADAAKRAAGKAKELVVKREIETPQELYQIIAGEISEIKNMHASLTEEDLSLPILLFLVKKDVKSAPAMIVKERTRKIAGKIHYYVAKEHRQFVRIKKVQDGFIKNQYGKLVRDLPTLLDQLLVDIEDVMRRTEIK